MSGKPKVHTYQSMRRLVQKLRDDLNNGGQDFVLLYAYNGTGKTRLSMAFKESGKRNGSDRDTLYFNAFTEDLFTWDNDLAGDSKRALKINSDSLFFSGLEELEMESRIRKFLDRYADFDFSIDYEQWTVSFSREVTRKERDGIKLETIENIKVSRGEENIFIWCFFLAIAQLAMDGAEAYSWVKYLYIDDPISSLDDNNAIAVASDLAQLLKTEESSIHAVISSHHSLFFNVMCNELKKLLNIEQYFSKAKAAAYKSMSYSPQKTRHFFIISLILRRTATGSKIGKALYLPFQYALRSILEKTATFFGFDAFLRLY